MFENKCKISSFHKENACLDVKNVNELLSIHVY